ncbi:hypothetical protein F7725_026203 [Dissostichus mawsoni]|uniref:Myomesin 2 n=1 Tax=Dissostichus mawsoni TaxID=36200 RepID=A0A7J5X7X0_DISMA|nr:hypothetical protein F7725_026203 [Dissostichus mawsoni]
MKVSIYFVTMSTWMKRGAYDHEYHHKQSKYVVKEYSSSTAMEERYEHKTQSRIQEVVTSKMGDKYVREEPMIRGPTFLVRLRSHTVFEKTPIKLCCTVAAFPLPSVQWYKDGSILGMSSGQFLIEAKGGIHTLEIARCSTDDTAQYTAVACNSHGQASSQASVIVKRFKVEEETCSYAWLPYTAAMLPKIQYTKINITFLEKFGPVFATEGDSVTLTATMTLSPNLANLQPDAQWYRDDTRLSDSKWVKIVTGRGITSLTIPNLFKDDEGLYTIRMVTKGGTAEHGAFVSVSDGPPPVAGAPGAPMDIKIHDANRDYVITSWKPPNTTTEGPILGYFVDKVRAVNSKGVSKACRMSEPIAALDPTEFERLHGGEASRCCFRMYASETDRTYVVLSWKAPAYSSKAPMWYYIEKSLADSGAWQRVNTQVPIRSPRYAVFDLAEGKLYQFRVVSANIYGASEPSEPTGPIQTQELKGVPSAPGQVISTRETDTSVLIQWAPPKEPNNLIGYYIDQCVKGSADWTSANHKPHKSTKFVVSGLTKGQTYVFRVQAINELGLSDESQESAPLTVKAALTAPSAPYDIALLYCDGHSVVLNWKKTHSQWRIKHQGLLCGQKTQWSHRAEGLTEGAVYQFQVYAANLAGLGPASKHSADISCEAWTMPEPGPGYDLTFSEVRDSSMLVEWKKPVYTGSGSITGYHVEYAKKGTSDWTTANETAASHRFLKVTGLEAGTSYVLRVRAVNAAGVGMASMASDPVTAQAVEGNFHSATLNEGSQFVWKKDYKEVTDFSKGIVIKTEGSHSKLIFKNADKEDFGTYSVSVTSTMGVSSSHTITTEELTKMLALSHEIRHPVIPLKSELAYKILERGRMRFWLQAEGISSNVTYKFFANNKELSGADPNKMGHDLATGIIEFILDHFTEEDEGTFTCQIADGGGKAQSSLVLIGDAFKAALAEAEYQRREYIRVKEGPHFSEFLTLHVGEDCSVSLVCKVSNLKKESAFLWYKEDTEIVPDVKPDMTSGVCKLPIKLFSLKTAGVYKATISDDRGKDMSQIDISGKVFENAINKISQLAAPQSCLFTAQHRLQLQCHMKSNLRDEHRLVPCETKLAHSDKIVIGGTPAMATMEMIEPMEKDKGLYSIVITDPAPHTTHLDLSGDVYEKAFAEFQKLNVNLPRGVEFPEPSGPAADLCSGPLPDSLTPSLQRTAEAYAEKNPEFDMYSVWGPQASGLMVENGADVIPDDQYVVSIYQGRFASLTINGVSVYRHGEQIPEARPTLTPKTMIPPKLPIEIPQPKSAQPPPSPPPPLLAPPLQKLEEE